MQSRIEDQPTEEQKTQTFTFKSCFNEKIREIPHIYNALNFKPPVAKGDIPNLQQDPYLLNMPKGAPGQPRSHQHISMSHQ